MSLLYSTCSTPRSMSQLSVSAFDEKASELDALKKKSVISMRKFNALKLRYMDWWSRRSRSFLAIIQKVQLINCRLCPQHIINMSDFNKICSMIQLYIRAGKISATDPQLQFIYEYQHFWKEFHELHAHTQSEVFLPVSIYCESITRLRDENIKKQIDALDEGITLKLEEDYDVTSLHDARENLFIYSTGVPDKELTGFVNYLPHVINMERKRHYLVTKLHVEKE